jgi:hypothetical protein
MKSANDMLEGGSRRAKPLVAVVGVPGREEKGEREDDWRTEE